MEHVPTLFGLTGSVPGGEHHRDYFAMKLAVTLFLGLTLTTPGVAQKIKTVFDKATDFAEYRTFSVEPGRRLKDNGVLENPYLGDQIVDAIRTELAAKGMTETTDEPDLQVNFFVGNSHSTQVDRFDHWTHRSHYKRGVSLDEALHNPRTSYYRKGILVIDMVDTATDGLVWRVYGTAKVSTDQDRREKIYKGVKKAFKKYPPKVKK